MSFQGIQKPKVEKIMNTSPVILITQHTYSLNQPRFTVGTMSDMYMDLRMILLYISIVHIAITVFKN